MRINSTPAVNVLTAFVANQRSFTAAPAKSAGAGLFGPLAVDTVGSPASPAASKLDGLFIAIEAELQRHDRSRRLLQQVRTDLDELRVTLQGAHDETVQRQTVEKWRPVFETREKFVDRDITEQRSVFEERDVFETRNVYETRDVYETRNIYETRPVYEQQPIYETNVTGTRDLSGYSSVVAAGIDVGADLAVKVGNDSTATVKFTSASQISVTVDGTTTNFTFALTGGDWRNGLLSALSSISGLTADYTSDGKLHLKTSAAQSLTISDLANGPLDFSGSPLGQLGLTAGTTQASVVGYNQVQVGTEQVVVGTEQVLVGTEQVLTGTEQVKIGTEQSLVGTENVLIETIRESVGTEEVLVGLERETPDGESRDGRSTADEIGDRAVALRSSIDAIHLGLSGLTSLRSQPLAIAWEKDPVNEIGAIISSLDPISLADPTSADEIADGLSRIDSALDRVDDLEASLNIEWQPATTLDPMSAHLGAILGWELRAPQSEENALLLANAVADSLRKTAYPIRTRNLLSFKI